MLFTLLGYYLFNELGMDVLQVIGTLVLAAVALRILGSVYKYFLRPGKNLTKYGKWAVITGATDGIGLAFAESLAKKGFNLVLISRTQARLDEVAQKITEDTKVEVRTLAVDYTQFSLNSAAYTKVQLALKDLEVGILINNVGFSKAPPLFFTEIDDEDVDGMLKTNIQSVVWMSKLVMANMVERKRGCIINIGSGAANTSAPLLATYAGTKSFMQTFSAALAAEAPAGIDIQCQIPLFVATKLAKMRKSLLVPSPPQYVKYALRAVGHDAVISPFWGHALQLWFVSLVPGFLAKRLIKGQHLALRKRGLAKLNKQK